jgi:AcrR family transcriptional regulator
MAQRGRPRSFDREQALQQAMEVFWALGYESATLADLQTAMGGITAPSFYAAFGSKEELFREAVDLYCRTVGTATVHALTKPTTARASIKAMLRGAVDSFCGPDKPRGCLIVLGTMTCARASRKVRDHLLTMRLQRGEHIRQRLERGVEEGDLPAGLDLAALAFFYTTVLLGLAVQARDGASCEELMAAVDGAMAAWGKLVAKQNRSRA